MKKNIYSDNDEYRIKQKECSDYNTYNRLCYKTILFNIKNYITETNNYLDIGSQEGQFASLLNENIKINNIYCNDINYNTVINGEKKFPKFNWIHSDIENMETHINFDLITSLNVIYCFFNEKQMKKIYDLLNDKGYFIILYGNINFDAKNITYDDIIELFQKVGFKIINTIQSYENIKMNTTKHLMANRWYSCLVLQK